MSSKQTTSSITPCVIVHGGAFNVPENFHEAYRNGTQQAAFDGYKVLENGGSALDAAETAVRYLEDNHYFNAGHGSVLTESGTIEMDAIVVEGHTLMTGAVAGVSNVSNAVSLARTVMEKSSHCLMVGQGAMDFAAEVGFPILENPLELITEISVCKSFNIDNSEGMYDKHIRLYMNDIVHAKDNEDLQDAFDKFAEEKELCEELGHDTVGAVAVDSQGHVACATSTGGTIGKKIGRVGDSPLFGCGAYADKVMGCSSTGHGESLLRITICRLAGFYIEQGMSPMEACQKCIEQLQSKTGGRGGIILLDHTGKIGYAFSTSTMAWASASADGIKSGMLPGELENKTLESMIESA